MDWITTEIAIGNYVDANEPGLLKQEGICSILCLDGCLQAKTAEDLGVRRLAVVQLTDGPGNSPAKIKRAVDAVSALLRSAPPLLVHCHAGRSRSAMVVALHLAKQMGIDPSQGLELVAGKREISITAGLERMLYLPLGT